ncbi:phosphotransferase [Streptomyces albipurpureus]|uniref:Aminoglycoside phosphotransferase family protein n=1 Tax=Streptomyces albipurpureus TaxID=2897419 RepID=A0ABT0V4F4_9ACTN|nr:phosphotransferase [Streptomyces sp. CWNU-1]MCM2394256.1 aminoglycoside phosphotransferase family protein [Streptomyces sp. CWNU-1]
MTDETASAAHRQAVELSNGDGEVFGPLKGYHHETYAFSLPEGNPLCARYKRGKLRAPRLGVFWYDRRCFASEDRLLTALQGRISRIPDTVEVAENIFLQGFVEGAPPSVGALPGRPLIARQERQLMQLFQELVTVKASELDGVPRTCEPARPCADSDDSTAFLQRMIDFTEDHVYRDGLDEYGEIFDRLGVRGVSLEALRAPVRPFTARPFTLVHGDLHRRNFIVDTMGDLWTIDWELAMIGDPLYELATHLHLMRYSRRDAQRIGGLWARAVESMLPGSARGWERDLPHLLAYKRTQSVFTDVIRTARALGAGTDPHWTGLPAAAWKVRRALVAARRPLRLREVPNLPQVMAVYTDWLRARGG